VEVADVDAELLCEVLDAPAASPEAVVEAEAADAELPVAEAEVLGSLARFAMPPRPPRAPPSVLSVWGNGERFFTRRLRSL